MFIDYERIAVHARQVATRQVIQRAAGTARGNHFRQLAWRVL